MTWIIPHQNLYVCANKSLWTIVISVALAIGKDHNLKIRRVIIKGMGEGWWGWVSKMLTWDEMTFPINQEESCQLGTLSFAACISSRKMRQIILWSKTLPMMQFILTVVSLLLEAIIEDKSGEAPSSPLLHRQLLLEHLYFPTWSPLALPRDRSQMRWVYAELTPFIRKGVFCNIKSKECLGHIPVDGWEGVSPFSEPLQGNHALLEILFWFGVVGTFAGHSQSHADPSHLFGIIAKCQQAQWPHEKCPKRQTVFLLLWKKNYHLLLVFI